MQLDCDVSAAIGYKSRTQISRVLSEKWFCANGYCLSCETDRLTPTPANSKAWDFSCPNCGKTYELKAFGARPARRLVDGAYSALMSRIQSDSVPTLMLLHRNEHWQIQALTAIHHLFLTPEVIEKRKPLSPTARRAGWVGCSIRLDLIGEDAQIPVIHGGVPSDPILVRSKFKQFERLKSIPVDRRGWATLTLSVVRSLRQHEFSLAEVYSKEQSFLEAYPKNNNVRAKVRQQLQVLRDLGYLEFLGSGTYRLLV
jgi:type II restriction enzyme